MNKIWEHFSKWNKSDREQQLHSITYMGSQGGRGMLHCGLGLHKWWLLLYLDNNFLYIFIFGKKTLSSILLAYFKYVMQYYDYNHYV